MQFLKIEGKTIDQLTETEYNEIRKRHAQASYDIILKRVGDYVKRDDFHLPNIDEEYLRPIALVSKGHATNFFEDVIKEFENDPAYTKNRPIRGELLTSLLMIADEFDMQGKRVDFSKLSQFDISDYAQLHWFKHHYVDFIEIKKGIVNLKLKFPQDSETYQELFKELIATKLEKQITKVNPILREFTGGKLNLSELIQIDKKVDITPTKRELPEGVLKYLREEVGNSDLSKSDNKPDMVQSRSLIPKPKHIFAGREKELKQFENALKKSNIISIEGLGGIGKTEFAAKCIERFVAEKKAVWFECIPDSKLDSLIELSGYPEVIKGENKTELAKYSGFTDLLERDEKIIFIDDFQDAQDKSFNNFLEFSGRRLSKAKIVLISREHTEIEDVLPTPIQLDGLKNDSIIYAKKIIETAYRDLDINDKALERVCDTLKGHPLAIELAVQLLSFGETPDNIIPRIVHLKDKSEQLSKRLLDEIFNHPKSTDQEKKLMLNFSIFRGKIKKEAIQFIFENDNILATLYKLIDKLMITRKEEQFETHPLVREFCYELLENKTVLHRKAAEYFKTERTIKLDPILEERVFYHLTNSERWEEAADLISEKGEEFVLLGHTNSLMEMIDEMHSKGFEKPEFYLYYGDIAQIKGKWNDASNYYDKAFSLPDVEDKVSAEAFIKYGEILFRKGEVKESLRFFEDAYEICKKSNYPRTEARSLNDIGSVYKSLGNMILAEKKITEANQICKDIKDRAGIATSLNNLGLIFQAQGDFKAAKQKHNEGLKIKQEIGDREGTAASLNNLGLIWGAQGDFKAAKQKLNESLKIREDIGDRAGIASSLNNIGSVFDSQGDLKAALEKYNESLKIREDIGDRKGIANSSHNIGTIYEEEKNYFLSLQNLFKSLALNTQMEVKSEETLNSIFTIRKSLGLAKFKECAEQAYNNLNKDLNSFLNLEDITKDTTIKHETPQVRRNDPCPCGSGKKYKKCHGQI
ncbi:tetratricopeptide repeat protein [candidate division KSB1 bacterium]|nr:tetratricopeptide repeat protein [candidate division KSB1 bacterium]